MYLVRGGAGRCTAHELEEERRRERLWRNWGSWLNRDQSGRSKRKKRMAAWLQYSTSATPEPCWRSGVASASPLVHETLKSHFGRRRGPSARKPSSVRRYRHLRATTSIVTTAARLGAGARDLSGVRSAGTSFSRPAASAAEPKGWNSWRAWQSPRNTGRG